MFFLFPPMKPKIYRILLDRFHNILILLVFSLSLKFLLLGTTGSNFSRVTSHPKIITTIKIDIYSIYHITFILLCFFHSYFI